MLPTPKSMKAKSDKTLWAEMERIWKPLRFDIKNKFFAARNVKLDEVAEQFGFKSEADFINKLGEEFSALAQSGYKMSLNEGEFRTPTMPTTSQIAEAERQYKEVYDKYFGTPLWMKAPNGKPTKLTERQWVQVRTPSFKKWFGDWKKLAEYSFLNGTPIANITGYEIAMQENLPDIVMDYFKNIVGKTHFENPVLGEIDFNKRGVKASISKGMGSEKAMAFASIGDVIEKGVIIDFQKNWQGRGYDTAIIAAPIKIGNEIYIVEVVVEQKKESNKFYVHEVTQKRKLGNVFQTKPPLQNAKLPSTSQASLRNILFNIFNVKPESVSKVVDENGEPMVVYHGTIADFNVYNGGAFFTDDYMNADGYASGEFVYEVFLDIKSPLKVDGEARKWDDLDTPYGNTTREIVGSAEAAKQDGVIFRNIKDNWIDDVDAQDAGTVYYANKPSQIKSATDNTGEFDAKNPDIRFSTGATRNISADKFEKEYNDFVAKYKDTPLWMKAPNGKPTKLTERQWVQVRTPSFKKWFGDWETLAEATMPNQIFDINEAFEFAKNNLFGEYTNKKNPNWTAKLSRNGLDKMNSGSARGKTNNNRLHALALANIGTLFENSELLESETPRNQNPDTEAVHKFYAPLLLNGEMYAVKITAKQLNNPKQNNLYSIEGIDIKKEPELSGLSEKADKSVSSTAIQNSDSVKRFFEKLRNVKPETVSKVVDENGEPLVVYHGTRSLNDFYEFKGREHFFTSNKDVADAFLNGNDFVLEVNGEAYPFSRRDLEYLADIIYADKEQIGYLLREFEAGELHYGEVLSVLSDITGNDYTAEALADFPFEIRKGGVLHEAFLNKEGKLNKERKRYFEGFGISHIIAQRDLQGIDGKAFAMQIPEILVLGNIVKEYGSNGNERANISYLGSTVVIKKEGGSNHWIITAFVNEDNRSSVSDHSTYNLRNPEISSAKGASSTYKSSKNPSESQADKKAQFSVANSSTMKKRRLAAMVLAKRLYDAAGKNFNPKTGESAKIKATQEDREWVYVEDLGFLDDDVEWIINRAETLACSIKSD